jgi:hypothetical protein
MIRLLTPPLCIAALLLAGCSTPTPIAHPPAESQSQASAASAMQIEALKTVGLEVRSTRIYVDVVPVMATRDGVPVINTTHSAAAGRAAMAALQEAFASRGFRAASGEFTSIGLGAPAKQVLITSGPEAPAPATLPVLVSNGLSGSDRSAWVASLYGAVHSFATTGSAPATLAATYLSPNLSRIEVFAVLTGGDGPVAHLWVVAFDSRNGQVLWTGSASEAAAVLDTAVATSLVRSLVGGLPMLVRADGTL